MIPVFLIGLILSKLIFIFLQIILFVSSLWMNNLLCVYAYNILFMCSSTNRHLSYFINLTIEIDSFASILSIFEHGNSFRVEFVKLQIFTFLSDDYNDDICPMCHFDTIALCLFHEDMGCLSLATNIGESFWLLCQFIWGTGEGMW